MQNIIKNINNFKLGLYFTIDFNAIMSVLMLHGIVVFSLIKAGLVPLSLCSVFKYFLYFCKRKTQKAVTH